ncbi:NADH-quinone oxidoreductase subunit N [Fodinisporobacter ferrooxydans]|uniref:NADH-quinone oxidoreductase subunit N n=1 Tax=Fodinisporobacter ferrooxydans TaxID=2901836 RepID=A0ABY4CMK0_9BACL|nr:NADH-quinone oxidoreductase subunit N [Alicyclobacillaceae bacterium MYW30-H2]
MNQPAAMVTFHEIWAGMAPEVVLTGFAFLLMVLDLFISKESRKSLTWLAILGIVIAIGLTVRQFGLSQPVVVAQGLYYVDGYSSIFKLLFLVTTGFVLLMSIDYNKRIQLHIGEYPYLLLFATVGAMVMASALELITLYVGLELLSITSYVLIALRRDEAKSSEGAMKYLVVGSIASAFILYGMSFIYGFTGTTNIAQASSQLAQMWDQAPALILMSLLFLLIGFGVKVSLVPFHMWAPDAYEGAPTPITAFLAVLSKAAAIAMMVRVFIWGYSHHYDSWYLYIAVIVAVTMIVGNVAALPQRNFKRLMAYSSIAQAGYVLIPLAVLGKATQQANLWQGLSQIVFYLSAYVFMTVGAFTVHAVISQEVGTDDIDGYAGLYKRSPWLAVCMGVFLLSMAGIPITSGFFGKFYIFIGAINFGFIWLAAILFLASAIAFYYYFGVLRRVFVREPAEVLEGKKIDISFGANSVLILCVLGTILLGVYPDLLLNVLSNLHWFG